jgi:uncharacterized repeat protein (TIGR02543 family)
MRPRTALAPAGRIVLSAFILLSFIGGVFPARAAAVATATLPDHFGIGVSAHPDSSGIYGWMPDSGIAWDYAYQYLAAGVNTGNGWAHWNERAQFPLWYAQGASQHGYIPVFTYYQLFQSSGPCNGCGEVQRDLANLNSTATMAAYFNDFTLLMKRLGAGTHDGIAGFGGTAIVHIEPDLSGYAQQAALGVGECYGFCTGQGNDPALVRAAVASSGVADVASFPNTYQGFNWALLHLRDRYAPNVQLAIHLSGWATGIDVGSDRRTDLDPTALGTQAGQFAALSGATSVPGGVTPYDLLFNDVADRDAAYYKYVLGRDAFWDRENLTFPNFHRWETYLRAAIAAGGSKPTFVWQIPLGNQIFATMNNTAGHYQDNRAEYFFGHIAELADLGVVGLLFGAGNPGSTTNADTQQDGITNPAPTCTTDGGGVQRCASGRSTVADDDGGYVRQAAGQYYAAPLPLPGRNPAPSPSPGGGSYTLALTAAAGGSVSATPDRASYAAGEAVRLIATPAAGYVFTGWTVDGSAAGWASPATLTMRAKRVVRATFAPIPPLRDLPADPARAVAVRELAARGIIRGCDAEAGLFCPTDPIARAQMAALIVRAMGWPPSGVSVPFSDRGPVDDELWAAVGTLAARGVARGYGDGTYDPTGPVLQVQTIAFITRAMVGQGWWQEQPDNPALYPGVPAASGHREDIATWVRYAGLIPGTSATDERWPAWSVPAEREWFALALWTALDRQFRVATLP